MEGPEGMVAHVQLPPPPPVTMSYYSKSKEENSSLKRIIFVSVKLQSRALEEPATEMFFRSAGVLGQKGKQWARGHHLYSQGQEGPWALASPRKLHINNSISVH